MNLDYFFVDELIAVREDARRYKDWKTSDLIRDYLDKILVFAFDTKDGQEVYYVTPEYFKFRPKLEKTKNLSDRQYVEYKIKESIRAENNLDAWIYSMTMRDKK